MEKKYQIGNFITKCREEKKLTQSKLGELLGVSNKAVSKWENGKSLPNTKIMTKLCDILQVSLEELLNGARNEIQDEKDVSLTEFEHVFKYYNNDSRVEIGLYDINLSFNLGEIVAICGVSGSGKTTLIKAIGGLDTIESGEIYLQKEGISRYDEIDFEEYRKSYISYVFQDYGILENYTILDNLLIIRLLMGDSYNIALSKANNMLKEINLYNFRNKKASKLSGGQKQKLSVARAIMKDAPILLGDEITANLDSKQAKDILKLLMNHATNKLVILVTHNYSEIEEYVTRKISLEDGRIIEDVVLKEIEKKPLKLKKTKIKEKFSLPVLLFLKYFKTNILKNLMTFLVILIAVFTILGVNYTCDYGYETCKYTSKREEYADDEIELLNKEGFTKTQIDELINKEGINDFRILISGYSLLRLDNLRINNDLKDNEIQGPEENDHYYGFLDADSTNGFYIYGNYIINEYKEDENYYLNYKNYLLVYKYATSLYNISSLFLINEEGYYLRTTIKFDLNNHDMTFKTRFDDSYKLIFDNKTLNVEYLCDIEFDLFVSFDYLEEVLSPYEIISYGAIIKYDDKSKNNLLDFFSEKNYLYVNNDLMEPNLQSSEMLFINELLFIGISILPFFAMIFITNKILFAYIKSRKNELTLLRKIGFSKNVVIKSILVPIVIILSILIIVTFIFPFIINFSLIDIYLLMLFEEFLFAYMIIKNLKQKLEVLIKEVS